MNDSAINAYIDRMNVARAALDRISEYLDNNGETAPDDINWGHVSSMNRLVSQVTEVADMIYGTGIYAPKPEYDDRNSYVTEPPIDAHCAPSDFKYRRTHPVNCECYKCTYTGDYAHAFTPASEY